MGLQNEDGQGLNWQLGRDEPLTDGVPEDASVPQQQTICGAISQHNAVSIPQQNAVTSTKGDA